MADLMPANIPLSPPLHAAEGGGGIKEQKKIPGYKKKEKNPQKKRKATLSPQQSDRQGVAGKLLASE